MAISKDCSFLPPPRILTRGRFLVLILGLLAFTANAMADVSFDGTTFTGDGTYSAAVQSDAALTATPATGATITLSGVISGACSITQNGAGTLVISGNNTFTGETKVLNGTLNLTTTGSDSRSPKGKASFAKGATITVEGESSVLKGHGTIFGYGAGSIGRLNLYDGGTLENDSTGGHITISAPVYMNNGVITSSGNGDDYGNFIIDCGIHVIEGTENSLSAVKFQIRNDQGYGNPNNEKGGTFDIASGAKLSVNSNISNFNTLNMTPQVVKKGEGELVLSGASTYSTGTQIEAGTLTVSNNAALGNSGGTVTFTGNSILKAGTDNLALAYPMTINSGKTGTVDTNGKTMSLGGAISGTGALTKTGAGTLTLSGANTYTGTTTINGGTLKLTNSSTMGTGTATVASGATVEIATDSSASDAWTWGGGNIGGTGTLKVTGGGEFEMPISKMKISNGIIIADGTHLTLSEASGSYHISGLTINVNNGGTVEFARTSDSYVGLYFDNTLHINFDQNGGGTLNTGDEGNSYLNFISNSQITFTTNGGATNYITGTNGINTHHYNLNFDVAKGTAASGVDLEVSAILWNTKGIVKNGAGTMALTYDNTYTGGTTINAGTLKLVGAGSTGTGTVTVNDNGTLEYNVAEGVTKELTVEETNAILSTGTIKKTGDGTLKLFAADEDLINSHSFVVSSGRLDMTKYFKGALTVGEKLDPENYLTAIFSPGNSVGSLEITGDFTLNPGSTLLLEFDEKGADSLLVSGTTKFEEGSIITLALDEGASPVPNQQVSFQLPANIATFDNAALSYPSYLVGIGYDPTTGVLSATVDANAVPEPSTWALLALGVVVLFLRKRVRN